MAIGNCQKLISELIRPMQWNNAWIYVYVRVLGRRDGRISVYGDEERRTEEDKVQGQRYCHTGNQEA